MDNPKWWHTAVGVIAVVLTGMLLLTPGLPASRLVGALGSLAVFVVSWYTIGRLSWRSPVAAIVFTSISIVAAGIATGFYPAMAIVQAVVFPLIWVITPTLPITLVANAALTVSIFLGLSASDGFSPEAIAQAAFIEFLSLGFSVALGLWIRQIVALSTQKQHLIDELQAAEGQLAALHRDAGVASERERLARELHDTTAQSLTGLVMLVQGARRSLDAHNWDETGNTLALIEDNARETLSETRALVASGAAVEVPGGIMPALQRLATRFERETGVTVTVDADSVPTLNRDTEVVLLRCTQEALSNVRKHADATSVTVSLGGDSENVHLQVSDDGTGFDPENAASGFGLTGMRERLALVDGNLDVTSSEGTTILSVRIPTEVLA